MAGWTKTNITTPTPIFMGQISFLCKFLLSKSTQKPLFFLIANGVHKSLATELQITQMPRLVPECINLLTVHQENPGNNNLQAL